MAELVTLLVDAGIESEGVIELAVSQTKSCIVLQGYDVLIVD
jgi:hypothetical protein